MVAEENRDLLDLWSTILEGRWLVIAIIFALGSLGALYAVLSPKWYRAEVLLAPAGDRVQSNLVSQLGGLAGLAGLAGINLGNRSDIEPLAVLKSRGFARTFIEKHELTTVLLASKWDLAAGQWKGSQEDWPDVRDAVTYFDDKVRRVFEDRKTGMVTLAVEWKDPEIAARWASLMARELNDQMRERAMTEATENVGYLRAEIAANNLVVLQQSLGRLLELELQKLMLARSSQQYSFRVVDPAQVPKRAVRPKLVPSIALGTLLGAVLSIVVLFIGRMARASRAKPVRI